MNAIPFDVNDETLRQSFLANSLGGIIHAMDEHALPRWGSMKAQHMIEHLTWAFKCSTGKFTAACHTPEHLLERTRRFLYDNRETPQNFKNPLLGEHPMPYIWPSCADAKAALRTEVECYLDQYRTDPAAAHTHPIFGSLDGEQWHRAHFKHCYHHLLQFNIIEKPATV